MSASKGIIAQVVKSTRQHSSSSSSSKKLISLNSSRRNNPSAPPPSQQQQQQRQQPQREERLIHLRGNTFARIIIPSPYTNFLETSKRRLPKNSFRHFSTAIERGTSTPTIHIYNTLDQNTVSYSKSWAWQHILLSNRLEIRRRRRLLLNDDDDNDCLLFLEHSPVYTLGRGSDVSSSFLFPLGEMLKMTSYRKISF